MNPATCTSDLEAEARMFYYIVAGRIGTPTPPWERLPRRLQMAYREGVAALRELHGLCEMPSPRCKQCGRKLECSRCD